MLKISHLRYFLLATLLNLGSLTSVNAETPTKLTVNVNGVRHQKGEICFRVYASEEGFPMSDTSEIQSGCTKITGKTVSKSFYGLPAGKYAVAIVHDENGNRKLDTNFFGIPKEGFGISNNPTVSIQTGTPAFSKSSFSVSKNTTVNISIKYSLDR